MRDTPEIPQAYERALAGVGAATLAGLHALETGFRRLHPPQVLALREKLAPVQEQLVRDLETFHSSAPPPEELEAFHEALAAAAGTALGALERFCEDVPGAHPAAGVLASMEGHARAQELLYPLRLALPPLGRYFVEPVFHDRLEELDPPEPDGAGVGLHRTNKDEEDTRGGFSLYVPERFRADTAWPLVVALHGGYGNGRSFLWTWLREARGRGFLLLAPTSRGGTWAFQRSAEEATALTAMLDFVCERWNVDRERVLLTGLSDGATFSLLAGLAEAAPYTALAPVSGVLHPENLRLGNIARARGRRIYLTHGSLDWVFPISAAHRTRDTLAEAGADLTFREIADLSHTYPREENARILRWFDPGLALPGDAD